MGDTVSWIGVVISALSLLVAIVAIVKSGRAQGEANAAQRRIVEIEEQREQHRQHESTQAKLRLELRQAGQHFYRLYLVNHGAAEAQNIRVEMDGKPLAEHPAGNQNDPMPDLVDPHSEISCPLRLHLSCTPPFKLKVIWDDASGKDRTYRSTLTW
jgi:hypothetical protein